MYKKRGENFSFVRAQMPSTKKKKRGQQIPPAVDTGGLSPPKNKTRQKEKKEKPFIITKTHRADLFW